MKTIINTLKQTKKYRILLNMIETAKLTEQLNAGREWTLFVPTDTAFGKLPKGSLRRIINRPEYLSAVMLHHLVSGLIIFPDAYKNQNARTKFGDILRIHISEDIDISVEDSQVIHPNIYCSNGIIHIIDSVLIPNFSEHITLKR